MFRMGFFCNLRMTNQEVHATRLVNPWWSVGDNVIRVTFASVLGCLWVTVVKILVEGWLLLPLRDV